MLQSKEKEEEILEQNENEEKIFFFFLFSNLVNTIFNPIYLLNWSETGKMNEETKIMGKIDEHKMCAADEDILISKKKMKENKYFR